LGVIVTGNMKIKNRNTLIGMIFLVGVVLFASNVFAIGVGYTEVLEVYPGQKLNEVLSLQNFPAGGGEVKFIGSVERGGEYVSFPAGNAFIVSDGSVGRGEYQVFIPENAKVGESHTVVMHFRTVPISRPEKVVSGSTIQLLSGVGFSFDVKVVEAPESDGLYYGGLEGIPEEEDSKTLLWVVLVVGLVLIVLVVFLLVRTFRKRRVEVVGNDSLVNL
jgi:hypothetical protein